MTIDKVLIECPWCFAGKISDDSGTTTSDCLNCYGTGKINERRICLPDRLKQLINILSTISKYDTFFRLHADGSWEIVDTSYEEKGYYQGDNLSELDILLKGNEV